jgi:tripartite-type tricarboxylate transporter receptor subunit TctC
LLRWASIDACDLVPIIRFATVPYVIGVPASIGLHGAPDPAALARKSSAGLNFASSGNGSVPQLCAELFNLRTGAETVHVTYQGGAHAMNEVASGQVQMYCGGSPSLLAHVGSGRIALGGSRRRTAADIRAESQRWAEVVKASGARVD